MEKLYQTLSNKIIPRPSIFKLSEKATVHLYEGKEKKVEARIILTKNSLVIKPKIRSSVEVGLLKIYSITVSNISAEFVLHIEGCADIRLTSHENRSEILQGIIAAKMGLDEEGIQFFFVKRLTLDLFCRSDEEAKRNQSRVPDERFSEFLNLEQFIRRSEKIEKLKLSDKRHTKTLFSADKIELSVESFELIRLLGKGAAGKVFLVDSKFGKKRRYAMKIIKKSKIIQSERIEHTKNEKVILSQYNYPFLVSLKYVFQNKTKIYFVMEFMKGGELFQHLKKVKRFSEQQVKFIIGCLILALGHLHNKDYIYRDLKPENVLLDERGYCKLTDFGLAKFCTVKDKCNSFCGTPEYMSPELIMSKGVNRPTDWWSLGILTYELLFGVPPFYNANVQKMYKATILNKLKFPSSVHCSEEGLDFISRLLDKRAVSRLGSLAGSLEVMSHPWLNDIDWSKLIDKKIEPPYRPETEDDKWINNFDEEFSDVAPRDSSDAYDSQILKKFQEEFDDFNFVNENFSHSNNSNGSQSMNTSLEFGSKLKKESAKKDNRLFQSDNKIPIKDKSNLKLVHSKEENSSTKKVSIEGHFSQNSIL